MTAHLSYKEVLRRSLLRAHHGRCKHTVPDIELSHFKWSQWNCISCGAVNKIAFIIPALRGLPVKDLETSYLICHSCGNLTCLGSDYLMAERDRLIREDTVYQ
jgi:hypothetical protein